MQLNPARGRKQALDKTNIVGLKNHGLCSSTPRGDGNHVLRGPYQLARNEVYAAQPREGTETTSALCRIPRYPPKVYAAQPREGTETSTHAHTRMRMNSSVYAAQPREGTETRLNLVDS